MFLFLSSKDEVMTLTVRKYIAHFETVFYTHLWLNLQKENMMDNDELETIILFFFLHMSNQQLYT